MQSHDPIPGILGLIRRRSGRALLLVLTFVALIPVAAAVFTSCTATEGLELRRLTLDGEERSYYLHIPGDMDPSNPAPLVIALHRFTGTGARMAKLTGFNAVADAKGFLVAYPNGKNRRFNVDTDSGPDDVAFILAVIEDIAGGRALDRSRVCLTGASNGGFLVYKLVCEHPETFAAAAPVMATFLDDIARACGNGVQIPMIIIHGDADPIVPYDTNRVFAGPGMTLDVLSVPDTVAFWAMQNGCIPEPVIEELPDTHPSDGTAAVRETYLDENGLPKVVHINVRQGGHTWPGGAEPLPEFIVGKQSQDFDASAMIWDFFALHSREIAPEKQENLP